MAERTIYVFDRTAITVRSSSGAPPRNGDVIANALNGNAFSWEVPNDLSLTFPTATTAITFDDSDGLLSDDPYAGDQVSDQRLTQPVTIAGQTYSPSSTLTRWAWPPPVTVENEYEVTLFDRDGIAYRMVGVSITVGYTTTVVGVMFEGATPPPGTRLFYRQGQSSYSGSNQTTPIPGGVPCFHAGTRIATPLGPRRIETLRIGDCVMTLDHGPRPIRWIGRSRVPGRGDLAPIRIAAQALGNRHDLFVSPNHRIFLQSSAAELHFGCNEVLVAARHLVNGDTIAPAPRRHADYLHLALDRHEIVFAEGLASESLHNGPVALSCLSEAARADLRASFPQFLTRPDRLARRSLTRTEARLLRPRHAPHPARPPAPAPVSEGYAWAAE